MASKIILFDEKRKEFDEVYADGVNDNQTIAFSYHYKENFFTMLDINCIQFEFKQFRKIKWIAPSKCQKKIRRGSKDLYYICVRPPNPQDDHPLEILGSSMKEDGSAWICYGFGYLFKSRTNAIRMADWLNKDRTNECKLDGFFLEEEIPLPVEEEIQDLNLEDEVNRTISQTSRTSSGKSDKEQM